VGEGDAPGNTWVDLQDWPPAATTVSHYLTADGGLVRGMPGAGELTLEIDPTDPVPTLGGANQFSELQVDGRPMGVGPMDQRPVEARDDLLRFTSDVLAAPVAVMGRVEARLWIRSDTPDLDLSVRLTDVYPDGRSMLVLDGIQRARMRCGEDRECFLEPGVPTLVEVDLWSTAMAFNAGHRIRVDVAGSNWPRFEVNPNDGGDLDGGSPTLARPQLLFGGEHPSALVLPHARFPRRPDGRHPR
jgi:putative CocE/NonD family hydrolase